MRYCIKSLHALFKFQSLLSILSLTIILYGDTLYFICGVTTDGETNSGTADLTKWHETNSGTAD